MKTPFQPLQLLLMMFSGWVNRHRQKVIDYLLEENRVLREIHKGQRLRLNDDQRPRLAVKGKILGRRLLFKFASIAVTERVNKTLKYEWLKRVPIIRSLDHLTVLCQDFTVWHNEWRPHMILDGARPDDIYIGKEIQRPDYDAKTVPQNIELRVFREVRVTGYRLKEAA